MKYARERQTMTTKTVKDEMRCTTIRPRHLCPRHVVHRKSQETPQNNPLPTAPKRLPDPPKTLLKPFPSASKTNYLLDIATNPEKKRKKIEKMANKVPQTLPKPIPNPLQIPLKKTSKNALVFKAIISRFFTALASKI